VIVRVVARNFAAAKAEASERYDRQLVLSAVWVIDGARGERAYTFRAGGGS